MAVPPEKMRSLGGSKFGSTFFVAEPAGTKNWHIRTRRTSVNWLPVPTAQRLQLIAMSINNIVGALRVELGVDFTTVLFRRPPSPETFDHVWAERPSAGSIDFDVLIALDETDEVSKDELRRMLEDRT